MMPITSNNNRNNRDIVEMLEDTPFNSFVDRQDQETKQSIEQLKNQHCPSYAH